MFFNRNYCWDYRGYFLLYVRTSYTIVRQYDAFNQSTTSYFEVLVNGNAVITEPINFSTTTETGAFSI